MAHIERKEQKLRRIIRDAAGEGRAVVAFSGGVDSSLVLWETVQSLGPQRVVAVTATSPTSFPEELDAALSFARNLEVEQIVLPSSECSDAGFMANPPDRCYLCKRIRYIALKDVAKRYSASVIFDGTQADDDPSDRPGMRALTELGILTPLVDAGIGKEDARLLLKAAGFEELAEKRAQPCLATRIPVGTPITVDALDRVRGGEAVLRDCGLQTIRLRDHHPMARIVTDKDGMSRLLEQPDLRSTICEGLRKLGYEYVTLDLEEYGKRR